MYNFYGKRTVFSFWREFEASVTILTTLTLTNAIWPKRAAHDLKRGFCTIFMESALFSLFGENLRPVWRFRQLWRSQMRFGQNVLRMTWKERFVQFSLKAHCFPVLKRIWGQCDDFDNFDAQKCDLAKTCSAWPEKSVMYNFHGECTVFPFCREFEASVTILRTLTLTNAIWPKRAAHDLKRAFCTIFMETTLFSTFGENFRPVWRIWELWRSKMRFGQNVLRMSWNERFVQFSSKAHCFPVLQRIWGQCDDFENFDAHKCDLAKTCCAWAETSVLYNFHRKRTVFPFCREFEASVTILRTLTLTNAIWPKRAAHDLKRGFCTIFMESALFSLFREISGQCDDFDKFDPHKCDLAKTCCAWPETSVLYNFYRKPHCFPLLARISGQCDHFENFDAQKCDLAKTCCAWPIKNVLYNFIGKRTVFAFLPFRREFETSVTIFRSLTLKNAILPNRAAHDLKRGFCTIFIISALFCLFGEIFRPVWRFLTLWRSQMRFGQNVLRMTWKERFVQFSLKAHCFPVLERIWGQCDDFDNFDAQKCDLAKTCSAWPEKSVMYNIYGKRTVFPFCREFEASVTILTTLRLKSAIWPKRAAHDLKRAFCTIFMESALFSRFEENLRQVKRIWEVWPSKMRFG